jgi:hypothetical protein
MIQKLVMRKVKRALFLHHQQGSTVREERKERILPEASASQQQRFLRFFHMASNR